MPNIAETQSGTVVAFPSQKDLHEICFLDSTSLWEHLQDWESYDSKGADTVARAVLLFSIRRVLEKKGHPWKPRFKGESLQALSEALKEIVNHREEVFPNRTIYPYRDAYRESLFGIVRDFFKNLMTDSIRAAAVSQHARGMSTANVARYLMSPDCENISVFHHLLTYQSYLKNSVVVWLTPRLSYLKIGTPSFPKKYHELWHSERAAYIDEIKDVPLTSTTEQVKALSDLYSRLDDAFNTAETERGKAMLAKAMVQTMSGLFTLTREPDTPALKKKIIEC